MPPGTAITICAATRKCLYRREQLAPVAKPSSTTMTVFASDSRGRARRGRRTRAEAGSPTLAMPSSCCRDPQAPHVVIDHARGRRCTTGESALPRKHQVYRRRLAGMRSAAATSHATGVSRAAEHNHALLVLTKASKLASTGRPRGGHGALQERRVENISRAAVISTESVVSWWTGLNVLSARLPFGETTTDTAAMPLS